MINNTFVRANILPRDTDEIKNIGENAVCVYAGKSDLASVREQIGAKKLLFSVAGSLEEAVISESFGADSIFADCSNDEADKIASSCTVPVFAIDENGVFSLIDKDARFIIRNIDCAVFDLDGTLLDSNHLWAKIDEKFLARRGFAVPADYIPTVSSMNFAEASVYTKERFSLPETTEEIIAEWREMAEDEYKHNIFTKPFAKEYLLSLKNRGIKLAVATSLSPALCAPVLQNNGIDELFFCCCSSEEVGIGKKSPDIFFHTAKKAGVAPERCIFFEDIPSAVRSAKMTGGVVCGVYDAYSRAAIGEMINYSDIYIMGFEKAPLIYKD